MFEAMARPDGLAPAGRLRLLSGHLVDGVDRLAEEHLGLEALPDRRVSPRARALCLRRSPRRDAELDGEAVHLRFVAEDDLHPAEAAEGGCGGLFV